jgi:hypothetical protein
MLRRQSTAGGFTLLEVLIATTLLFVAVAALAGLSLMATRANVNAKTTTMAALLAAQKIEQLRALPWGDAALVPSAEGYSDFLDAAGVSLGGGPSPHGSVYERQWSIQPLPSNPANALVIHVSVTRVGGRATDGASLTTVRTRTGT